MEQFEKHKYIFKKEENEIVKALLEQRSIILERDKFVAEFLDIEYPEAEKRRNRNSPIKKEKQKEKIIAMLSKKIAIEIQEKGMSDYSIREIEKRITGILECSINNEQLAYCNRDKNSSGRKNTVTELERQKKRIGKVSEQTCNEQLRKNQ
ncbi:4628_t:CDS:2, partial [Gigaspora margarita]